MSAPVLIMPDL
jgi:hypothetical protein